MRRELGGLLVAAGVLLVIISVIHALIQGEAEQGSMGYGGVILIGPIPIVFGSSPQLAIAAMLLAIALMVLSLLLFQRSR